MEGSNTEWEIRRLRDRVHELRGLPMVVDGLRREVAELHEDLPNLARQAAREAVSESKRREHSDTLANLRTYAALLTAGIALGALIVGLVLR